MLLVITKKQNDLDIEQARLMSVKAGRSNDYKKFDSYHDTVNAVNEEDHISDVEEEEVQGNNIY